VRVLVPGSLSPALPGGSLASDSRGPRPGRAGQPAGERVDVAFVRERLALLRLDRQEVLRRSRGRISARTLQRVANVAGTRISLATAAALGEVLGCGRRDVLVPSPHEAARIAHFDLAPAPPLGGLDGPAWRERWLGRPEEVAVRRTLAQRRAVVIFGPPGSGRSELGRRVAQATRREYPGGALWLGPEEPARARALLSECLTLLPPGTEEGGGRLARLLWSRRRLLVLDGPGEHLVRELLGSYRGPLDLLVLTDEERLVLVLEREIDPTVVRLAPLLDEQVLAYLLLRHAGDARLAAPGAATLRPAALRAVVARAPAALRTSGPLLRDRVAAGPAWRALLGAIAGRPGAVHFASDLLGTNRLRTLQEVADEVGASEQVNSPLLRKASPASRQLFSRLGLAGAEPLGVDWAAAASGLPAAEVRRHCDELGSALVRWSGPPGQECVALSPYHRGYGSGRATEADRHALRDGLWAKARAAAETLAHQPVATALGQLRAQEPGFAAALRWLGELPPVSSESRHLDLLLPLAPLLPAWRHPALEPALLRGLEEAGAAGRAADGHRLRLALGRWLVAARADFGRAELHFGSAAEGLEAEGRPLEAGEAWLERGVTLLATLRTAAGALALRRAGELSRAAGPPAPLLARRLTCQAFGESRWLEGPGGKAGWRRAFSLLDEAVRLLGESTDAGQAPPTACWNRALAARVLGCRGWQRQLGAASSELLAHGHGEALAPYLLATATACGIALRGSLSAQRRRLRDAWRALLELRGPAMGGVVRRLGQMAFYLNHLEHRDGSAWHASHGVLATDPFPPHAAPLGESAPLMFVAGPFRAVMDAEFLEAARRVLWEHGGPHLEPVMAQMEALRARVPGRGRRDARG